MEKYIYDENNGLWYELQGEYYIPCLTLPTEKKQAYRLMGAAALALSERAPIMIFLRGKKRAIVPCRNLAS